MNDAVFPSKVDRWLVALVLVGAVIGLAAVLEAWRAGRHNEIVWALSVIIGAYGLVAWLFIKTEYRVTGSELLVRCGPFRWAVPRADIVSVKPTRNPLSSPALSLDRLEIRYGNNKVIRVSPEDKAGFLRALDLEQPAD